MPKARKSTRGNANTSDAMDAEGHEEVSILFCLLLFAFVFFLELFCSLLYGNELPIQFIQFIQSRALSDLKRFIISDAMLKTHNSWKRR